eukprot:scaffold2953_cov187-Ochromonas_danica.AAC.8
MEKSEVSKTLYGQIQWEQLPSSGVFLQHRDHQLLERAQSNLSVVLDNPVDAKEYVAILVKVAESCTTNIVVLQYVYTRMEEILGLSWDSREDVNSDAFGMKHSILFTVEQPQSVPNSGRKLQDNCFRILLTTSDIYLQRTMSTVFAALLSAWDGQVSILLQWVALKLSSQSNGVWDMALPALSFLVRSDRHQTAVLSQPIVGQLTGILRRLGVNGNPQQLYDIVFILWALSLGCDTGPANAYNGSGPGGSEGLAAAVVEAFLQANVLPLLVELLGASPSRKVTRVIISVLRNLAQGSTSPNFLLAQDQTTSTTPSSSVSNAINNRATLVLNEMYTAGLMRLVENYQQNQSFKQIGDPEAENDFKVLSDLLHRNFRELSTFERWASEILSGGLRWGILHTEKFWRENAKFVEADNFALLRSLIIHLSNPDPTIACIALYDLGEFTRFYPNGRVVVARLGGKDVVMKMLTSENEEVQKHVLQCISKLMVNNWDHLR